MTETQEHTITEHELESMIDMEKAIPCDEISWSTFQPACDATARWRLTYSSTCGLVSRSKCDKHKGDKVASVVNDDHRLFMCRCMIGSHASFLAGADKGHSATLIRVELL